MRKTIIDLTNQKFNRLTVLEYSGKNKCGTSLWLCRCDCGTEKVIISSHLKNGNTASCGCLQKEIASESQTTHGRSYHPLYFVLDAMKQRCYNKNNKAYKNYGGRGITVCPEWRNEPEVFIDWAKANGYEIGLQIDRINNDGNYEPNNCRFVTRKENNNNRRDNKGYFLLGVFYTISQLAEKFNINYDAFYGRIYRGGTLQQALRQKVEKE